MENLDLMTVTQAFAYLAEHAANDRRGGLAHAMRDLHRRCQQPHVSRALEALPVDAMDLWVAYFLLHERETSGHGRESCGYLATTLAPALSYPGSQRRDKTGALLLWSVLARVFCMKKKQADMYRESLALLATGHDHFLLDGDGPRLIFSRPAQRAPASKAPNAPTTEAPREDLAASLS